MKNFEGFVDAPMFYDTVRIVPDKPTGSIMFFTSPRGKRLDDGTIKTFTHTNMHKGSLIPSDVVDFHLLGLKIEVLDPLHGAFPEFLRSNAVLIINERPWPDYMPMDMWIKGIKILEDIHIERFENFRVDVHWTEKPFEVKKNILDVRACLYGIPAREVKLKDPEKIHSEDD